MGNCKFSSTITIINGNPYVRPPDEVLTIIFKQAGKDKTPIPVRGKLNGAPFQQSLMKYLGDFRLYINGYMAKKAGIKYKGSISAIVGQKVKIEIEFDPKPPTYPMIPQFQKALDRDQAAKSAYEKLTPGRKKEILRYFSFMKTEEALKRNIERVMQHLRGEESDALYPLMHRKQEKMRYNIAMKHAKSIEEYIDLAPKEVQGKVKELRKTIKDAFPEAEEKISYGMPTFALNGKYVVYFALWKKHISLYPISSAMEAEFKEIADYKTSGRGTIQFSLDKPLPLSLIRKIVTFLVKHAKEKNTND